MENRLLLNIIEDRYRKFQKDYSIVTTDFFDLAQQSAAAGFVRSHAGEGVFFYGGYKGAERRKLVFVPDYIDVKDEEALCAYFAENPELCPLAVLSVKIRAAGKSAGEGKPLRHSDYLGSLLSLGIKREKTGDILVFEDGAQIIVSEEIAAYLAENYTSAGRTPLAVTVESIDKLKLAQIKIERLRLPLSSLRLDNAVAAVFGVSRRNAAEAIGSGLVFVNSVENKKPDFQLKGGEKLVLRGRGKAIFVGAGGTSRKGKIYAEFDRYL